MLSFLRAPLPPKTIRASSNPVFYEDGTSAMEYMVAGSDFYLRNTHPPYNEDRPSLMNPPLHYHIHQTESFQIISGECHLFRTTADVPWKTLSATDPDGLKTATIANKVYHTLRNASTTEPLVLDVKLSPEDAEGEQMFFRNFFGYLDDCRIAGQQPSIFQLVVFLKSANTPIGLPMPTRWLGLVTSRVFMDAMGWWGEWVLGYKKTYKEYYINRKAT